jgi:hypothetical protein
LRKENENGQGRVRENPSFRKREMLHDLLVGYLVSGATEGAVQTVNLALPFHAGTGRVGSGFGDNETRRASLREVRTMIAVIGLAAAVLVYLVITWILDGPRRKFFRGRRFQSTRPQRTRHKHIGR